MIRQHTVFLQLFKLKHYNLTKFNDCNNYFINDTDCPTMSHK